MDVVARAALPASCDLIPPPMQLFCRGVETAFGQRHATRHLQFALGVGTAELDIYIKGALTNTLRVPTIQALLLSAFNDVATRSGLRQSFLLRRVRDAAVSSTTMLEKLVRFHLNVLCSGDNAVRRAHSLATSMCWFRFSSRHLVLVCIVVGCRCCACHKKRIRSYGCPQSVIGAPCLVPPKPIALASPTPSNSGKHLSHFRTSTLRLHRGAALSWMRPSCASSRLLIVLCLWQSSASP